MCVCVHLATDGPGSTEVTRVHVTASDAVMSQLLLHGPVQILHAHVHVTACVTPCSRYATHLEVGLISNGHRSGLLLGCAGTVHM